MRLASIPRRTVGPVGSASTTQLLVSTGTVAVLVGATELGATSLSLVDLLVVLGVAVVLPLALPGGWWWATAALGAALSFGVGPGWAAGLAVPWVATAGAVTVPMMWTLRPRPRRDVPFSAGRCAVTVASFYALVAALAFATSRLGIGLFGIGEPIVELTAVHYTYAGAAALVMAAHAFASADGPWIRLGAAGVALTAAAPVIVALGFVSHHAVAQVGGAMVMSVGVWCTAIIELRIAVDRRVAPAGRALHAVSGMAIWLPMALAVAWAAGQHWDFPALSIPAMERTHGVANSLAFVLCGLLAFRRADRRRNATADPGVDRRRTTVGPWVDLAGRAA
jgi:hypothetical protein